MSKCNLPNVSFENFAAAKSCLQKTLAPVGAVVKRLSIQRDQNGKDLWRVVISATGACPASIVANFAAILIQVLSFRTGASKANVYEANFAKYH
jgi:hypothetical protein